MNKEIKMRIGHYSMDGIKTFWDGEYLFLVIETERLKDYIEYAEKNGNYNLKLYEPWGYLANDLRPLMKFPKIERLNVMSDSIETTLLPKWPEIEFLAVNNINSAELDVSVFPYLKVLRLPYSKRVKALEKAIQLTELGIECYGFKEKHSSLEFIQSLINLTILRVGNSKIKTLDCIECFKSLEHLDLGDNKELISIRNIDRLKDSLTKLEIEKSKKIGDIYLIGELKKLEYLRLSDCDQIASIIFINKLEKLKFFSFVETTIADGNLVPLINKKFQHVGFFNKKHYSHSDEEIRKLILDIK